MLHVKHRHVLMNRDLEPRRRRGAQQGLKLDGVQIVRGGQTLEAVAIFEMIGGQGVGDVEGEIANAPAIGEIFQVIVIAGQVAVGFAGSGLLERPFLAGFENARRRGEDFHGAFRPAREGHGFAVFF